MGFVLMGSAILNWRYTGGFASLGKRDFFPLSPLQLHILRAPLLEQMFLFGQSPFPAIQTIPDLIEGAVLPRRKVYLAPVCGSMYSIPLPGIQPKVDREVRCIPMQCPDPMPLRKHRSEPFVCQLQSTTQAKSNGNWTSNCRLSSDFTRMFRHCISGRPDKIGHPKIGHPKKRVAYY